MNNKFFAIFTLFAGILIFAFAIALENGWQPSLPSQNAVNQSNDVPVIPQDASTSIEINTDAETVPTIVLDEIIITSSNTSNASNASNAKPGAARRRVVQKTQPLESPTGLASDTALNYQPLAAGYAGHGVRGPSIRVPGKAFALPSRGLQRPKHETFVFEAK